VVVHRWCFLPPWRSLQAAEKGEKLAHDDRIDTCRCMRLLDNVPSNSGSCLIDGRAWEQTSKCKCSAEMVNGAKVKLFALLYSVSSTNY
jgi:hypothetical protein